MAHDPWMTHTLDADHDPLALREREWLLTNGTGAFAAGTAVGCPTRRYHGLLVAATQPPVGRVVTLNQVWEQLVLHRPGESTTQPLAFNTLMFRGPEGGHTFSPRGFELLKRFERGLTVRWQYEWGDVQVERELILHWRQQAITLRYCIRGLDAAGSHATLRLNPMLTLRDFHAMQHGDARIDHKGDGDTVRAYHEDLCLTTRLQGDSPDAAPARFESDPHWWYHVCYPIETERGQDDTEDYFVPGALVMDLHEMPTCEMTLTAALGPDAAAPCVYPEARAEHLQPIADALTRRQAGKQAGRKNSAQAPVDAAARCFAIASDDFIVTRRIGEQRLSTIIAGYPWFADWGRDTFIALPGLLLATRRHQEASEVLRAFAASIHNGLVPNRFDDYHNTAAHYNTVDASLWFIQAALQYLDATSDKRAWRDWLAPACMRIVDAYLTGTDFGIHCEDDGLVTAGSERTQLTWMDAAAGDIVFTPRPGKAVEVNALWYNAIAGLADHVEGMRFDVQAESLQGKTSDALSALARQVKRAFTETFWRDDIGHLIDHVWRDPYGQLDPDTSCRPNQVFAVALPHSPLAQTRQRKVLHTVRDRLLTPVGLRTLPRDDPRYHGSYRGNQVERDTAYHQGTIWPWLIGPYAEAVLRVGRFGPKAQREAASAIDTLLQSVTADPHADHGDGDGAFPGDAQAMRGSIGQLHEIYEAEPDEHGRHRPVGAFAQAWSVSEVLRLWRMLESAQA